MSFVLLEKPTACRDRHLILAAIRAALMSFGARIEADPGSTLDAQAVAVLRDLQAFGLEVRKNRRVHP